MYYWVIGLTFTCCALLFLAFVHLGGRTVEQGCSSVSLVHHVIALFLALWTHHTYSDRVDTDASFAPNTDFPFSVILQHFNTGYFLYDTVHVCIWDRRWLLHHVIALAGYASSDYSNVFALANAVNTWVTESGSLLYSAYLLVRSDAAYTVFVVFYTCSRMYFAVWSLTVLGQVKVALEGRSPFTFAAWCPYCAAILQVSLFLVNSMFAVTHIRKLLKKLTGGKKKKHDE